MKLKNKTVPLTQIYLKDITMQQNKDNPNLYEMDVIFGNLVVERNVRIFAKNMDEVIKQIRKRIFTAINKEFR